MSNFTESQLDASASSRPPGIRRIWCLVKRSGCFFRTFLRAKPLAVVQVGLRQVELDRFQASLSAANNVARAFSVWSPALPSPSSLPPFSPPPRKRNDGARRPHEFRRRGHAETEERAVARGLVGWWVVGGAANSRRFVRLKCRSPKGRSGCSGTHVKFVGVAVGTNSGARCCCHRKP